MSKYDITAGIVFYHCNPIASQLGENASFCRIGSELHNTRSYIQNAQLVGVHNIQISCNLLRLRIGRYFHYSFLRAPRNCLLYEDLLSWCDKSLSYPMQYIKRQHQIAVKNKCKRFPTLRVTVTDCTNHDKHTALSTPFIIQGGIIIAGYLKMHDGLL